LIFLLSKGGVVVAKTLSRNLKRLGRSAANDPLNLFCVGIGGTGVSGLAGLAQSLGHSVAGSDRKSSMATLSLKERGVKITFEQNGDHVTESVDLVVCSAAVPTGHPELVKARTLGIPIVKYAEALGAVFGTRAGIAIAGTHGKTTTSSMTAHVLYQNDLSPSFVIGGMIPQLGGSSAHGLGQDMVVEACEYDRSFLHLNPNTAVILNVEEDHFDCFPSLGAIIETFVDFTKGIKPGGTLIANADCPGTQRVIELAQAERPDLKIMTFGRSVGATVQASNVVFDHGFAKFSLRHNGKIVGRAVLRFPGEHTLMNALAAVTAASCTGLSWSRALATVGTFEGVNRRFTILHDSTDGAIIDDYAHHPTAISAVIETARNRFPGKRLVAVFEPHQHNRTRRLFEDFTHALGAADRVIIADIFRCRDADADVAAVGSERLAKAVSALNPECKAKHVSGADAILHQLRTSVKNGDTVLFMGAGVISGIAQRFTAMGRVARTQNQVDSASCAASGRFSRRATIVDSIPRILEREFGNILLQNESLARYVTFRAGGHARYFLKPRHVEEATSLVATLRRLGVPFHIMGGGSNSLYKDGLYPGAVIATRAMKKIEVRNDGLVTECGALFQKVLHRAELLGFSGLEGLAGIPATMGGAVAMNAGGAPHTPAVGDFVERIQVLETDGRVRWISAEDASFGYRTTNIGSRMILAVELGGFTVANPAEIRARRFEAAKRKAAQQPLSIASAGCIFRNPEGASAGRLIDHSGFKGFRQGNAEVSDRHANFIINRHGASASEILELIDTVKTTVEQETGRSLHLELQVKS
jgi:UDP-N-acetylmuramate--alanine ligase